MIIAGIDIGNASTETALARVDHNKPEFLASGIVATTGIKGTRQNIHGVFASLKQALDKANLTLDDVELIRLNEAAPVIGDVAMETITDHSLPMRLQRLLRRVPELRRALQPEPELPVPRPEPGWREQGRRRRILP